MLNRNGHSFGMPSFVNPHTLLGSTPSGSSPPHSAGGGSSNPGFQVAFAHAGSSAASLPHGPGDRPQPVLDPLEPRPSDHRRPADYHGFAGGEHFGFRSSKYAAVFKYDSGSLFCSA